MASTASPSNSIADHSSRSLKVVPHARGLRGAQCRKPSCRQTRGADPIRWGTARPTGRNNAWLSRKRMAPPGPESSPKRPQMTCLAKSTSEANTGRTHPKPRQNATPRGLRPKLTKPGSLVESTDPPALWQTALTPVPVQSRPAQAIAPYARMSSTKRSPTPNHNDFPLILPAGTAQTDCPPEADKR